MTSALLSPPTQKTCPVYGVEAAAHFLHNWFARCEGLVELRHGQRTPDGKDLINVRSEWFSRDRLDNLARYAVNISSEGREVFFGVCTRKQRKGDKSSVAMVPGLFVDLDFNQFEAGGIDAIEHLDRFRPEPTAVVHSGGGLHCYWKLEAALMPTPDIRAKIRALVRELGADRAATDLSRILRVPGIWNHKRDLPVRLLRCQCPASQ